MSYTQSKMFRQSRDILETLAVKAVCPCLYYDLVDNLDITTDGELLGVIEGSFACEVCS